MRKNVKSNKIEMIDGNGREMKKTIIVMPVANEENTMGGIIEKILALPYY